MREVVLDASVVFNWFAAEQRGWREARALRDQYEAGELLVVAPSLLLLELLNIAGRRWGWGDEALAELAGFLDDLLFDVAEPRLRSVAAWVARGLTAYDACYVALADERGATLITDDRAILQMAGDLAQPLVGP